MKFEYDELYVLGCSGSCDTCGSPQKLDNVIGCYKGEYPTGHLFEILTPFCCPGCHKLIDSYNVRLDIEVTKEYDTIKAP